MKQPFEEKVVNVDSDVVVVKRQVRGAWVFKTVSFLALANTCLLLPARPVEKNGPPFLEKGEKRFPVRDNDIERPVFKAIVLAEDLNKAFVQNCRDTLPAVMAGPVSPPPPRRC